MEDRWSSVTARVRELLDMGILTESGTKKDPETGAQGAVLECTAHTLPWLQGNHEPETVERPSATKVSPEFMAAVKSAVDNPGSLTAWNKLKQAYEEAQA